MKDVVRLLFITGAAVVAFGLAPQLSAEDKYVIECPLETDVLNDVCDAADKAGAPFQYMRIENILNTEGSFAVSFCGCPDRDITIEDCSGTVCANLEGPQILAPDSSRVSYGDGLEGSICRKETICIPAAGDVVCRTFRICKRD